MELQRKSNQLEGVGVVHAGTWLDSPDLDGVLRVCRTLLLRILMNMRECVHANVRLCMGFIGELCLLFIGGADWFGERIFACKCGGAGCGWEVFSLPILRDKMR